MFMEEREGRVSCWLWEMAAVIHELGAGVGYPAFLAYKGVELDSTLVLPGSIPVSDVTR